MTTPKPLSYTQGICLYGVPALGVAFPKMVTPPDSCPLTGEAQIKHQQGFVILIGLFVLVAMTLIAMPIFKISILEEKMAGVSVNLTQDLMDAESSVAQQELAFAALTDLAGQTLVDELCGIKEISGEEGGAKVRTTYYNPPPNGYNWGDGDGSKVKICHKYSNNLLISINAVGDETTGHMQHEGDYLGYCDGDPPPDPWTTCVDKFGDTPKRLSWVQLWDLSS